MKSQLAQAQEEKEQNSQVLTYKLEQIAMMEEKMKEVEAKLAEVTAEVQDISLRVFRALGLEVYARMDFIYDGRDFYCLEANTLPGMTPTSHLPQEAKAMGISYPELCMRIIELSLEKYNK